MSNYFQVVDNCPDGAMIGKTTSDKIGFFGSTPTPQRDSSTAATALSLNSFGITPASTDATSWGFDSSAHATTIMTALSTVITQCNALQAALQEKGIIA
jgi:hypothetical protein